MIAEFKLTDRQAEAILNMRLRSLRKLEEMGCSVEPCSLAFSREQNWSTWLQLRQFLVAGRLTRYYADPRTRALMKPEAIWEVEQSHSLTAAQLFQSPATCTDA